MNVHGRDVENVLLNCGSETLTSIISSPYLALHREGATIFKYIQGSKAVDHTPKQKVF